LVSFVGRHEDLRHNRQQAFQREFRQVLCQRVLIYINDLVLSNLILVHDLAPVDHRLGVSVLNANLDILQKQSFPPPNEPSPIRITRLLFRFLRLFFRFPAFKVDFLLLQHFCIIECSLLDRSQIRILFLPRRTIQFLRFLL